jgi:hypothetical protein
MVSKNKRTYKRKGCDIMNRLVSLLGVLVVAVVLFGCGGLFVNKQGITDTYSSWFGDTWQAFNAANPAYQCSPEGNGYVMCTKSNGSITRTVWWSVDDKGVIYALKWRQYAN